VGKVGEVEAPYLVMPLTVEPTKPPAYMSFCFHNLWRMVEKPCRFDNLSQLPRYLTKGSYQEPWFICDTEKEAFYIPVDKQN